MNFGGLGFSRQKMKGQHHDVFMAFLQRRHFNRDDIEAEVEIFPKGFLSYGFFEIGVGGGDDACIHVNGINAAEAIDCAFSMIKRFSFFNRISFVDNAIWPVGSQMR